MFSGLHNRFSFVLTASFLLELLYHRHPRLLESLEHCITVTPLCNVKSFTALKETGIPVVILIVWLWLTAWPLTIQKFIASLVEPKLNCHNFPFQRMANRKWNKSIGNNLHGNNLTPCQKQMLNLSLCCEETKISKRYSQEVRPKWNQPYHLLSLLLFFL